MSTPREDARQLRRPAEAARVRAVHVQLDRPLLAGEEADDVEGEPAEALRRVGVDDADDTRIRRELAHDREARGRVERRRRHVDVDVVRDDEAVRDRARDLDRPELGQVVEDAELREQLERAQAACIGALLERAHVCRCATSRSPASSSSACASAGRSTSKPSRQPPGEPGRLTTSVEPITPATPRGQQAVRRLRDRVGADRLHDPRRLAVDDGERRLGSDVARGEPGAARREDDAHGGRELAQRGRDLVALVRYDAPLDVVPLAAQQLDEQIAAAVLARSVGDAVRDGQHRRLQTVSFVFSTSTTSAIRIPLSIAFAMS